MQEKIPAEIFTDIGKWEHKWAWIPAPAMMEQAAAGRPTEHGSDSDTRELQNRLDAVTGQVKRLQRDSDKSGNTSRRSTAAP